MEAERGAKDAGAETELIHLYDLDYTDCKSCFACKLRGNQTNGICALHDDLRPALEKIHEANTVIIGSPVYYGSLTGETIAVSNLLTMNAPEEMLRKGYGTAFETTAKMIGMNFGSCETLYSCDTYQFSDYSKYYAGMFDEAHKAAHRDKQFPADMCNAYELGRRLAI